MLTSEFGIFFNKLNTLFACKKVYNISYCTTSFTYFNLISERNLLISVENMNYLTDH